MISALYAAIAALFIVGLSIHVINLRTQYRANLGDGDQPALRRAIAAQLNAIEYIPIALLLLLTAELNHAPLLAIHLPGISLLAGRFIHARGLLSDKIKIRVLGMQVTLYTIIGLALVNLIWLPYAKLFTFS